jgi:hypothetical protein
MDIDSDGNKVSTYHEISRANQEIVEYGMMQFLCIRQYMKETQQLSPDHGNVREQIE